MSLRRLRVPEWAALAAAAGLLALSFSAWFTGPRGAGRTAWEAFTVLDVMLLAPVLCGLALGWTAATRISPALPLASAVFGFVLGSLACVLVLVRFADQPGPDALVEVALGGWVGVADLVLLTAACWASMRIETPSPAIAAQRRPVQVLPAPAREGVPPLSPDGLEADSEPVGG